MLPSCPSEPDGESGDRITPAERDRTRHRPRVAAANRFFVESGYQETTANACQRQTGASAYQRRAT